MKKVELSLIIFGILILLSVVNILHAAINNLSWYRFIFGGADMAIMAWLMLSLPRGSSHRPIAFSLIIWGIVLVSVPATLFSHPSSLTGTFLIVEALYIGADNIWKDSKNVIIILMLHALVFVARFVAADLSQNAEIFYLWPAESMIKSIGGSAITLFIYFQFIHPRKQRLVDNVFDDETESIINLTYSGLRQKEIADKLSIDPKTVSRKLERARVKMNVKSDMELWEALSKKGHILR